MDLGQEESLLVRRLSGHDKTFYDAFPGPSTVTKLGRRGQVIASIFTQFLRKRKVRNAKSPLAKHKFDIIALRAEEPVCRDASLGSFLAFFFLALYNVKEFKISRLGWDVAASEKNIKKYFWLYDYSLLNICCDCECSLVLFLSSI